MKDLYKRLGVEPGATEPQIRAAISSPGPAVDADARAAAEFVLLDAKRRAAYDHTHRVLTTIGELRSHLGLNFMTFWTRGRLKDFTYELVPSQGRLRRRTLRSIRPADITRAFGLHGGDPSTPGPGARQRRLLAAWLLFAVSLAAVAVLIYFAAAS